MVLQQILENPLYNKDIKPAHLKGNQPLTPDVSAEASTEGLKVERMDASTAKMPKRDSFKQRVCSSTPGGGSERLKALSILGPQIHVLHSPQQHWRPRAWRRGMTRGSTGNTNYQVGLQRTEQAYVAESW